MPLVRSFWLGKKKGKEAWVKPVVEDRSVRFDVDHEPSGPAVDGTVGRSGAECIVCNEPVKFDHIRSEAKAGRMGQQLMSMAAQGDRRRTYLAPNYAHESTAPVPAPSDAPSSELPEKALGFRVQAYGMTRYADLFTNRQLVALTTFSNLVGEARTRAESEAHDAGLDPAQSAAYADAVATYLGLCSSKMAVFHSTLARWRPDADKSAPAFGRQAIPMVWDFAEVMPFAGAGGDWSGVVDGACKALEKLRPAAQGSARQRDARVPLADSPVWLSLIHI